MYRTMSRSAAERHPLQSRGERVGCVAARRLPSALGSVGVVAGDSDCLGTIRLVLTGVAESASHSSADASAGARGCYAPGRRRCSVASFKCRIAVSTCIRSACSTWSTVASRCRLASASLIRAPAVLGFSTGEKRYRGRRRSLGGGTNSRPTVNAHSGRSRVWLRTGSSAEQAARAERGVCEHAKLGRACDWAMSGGAGSLRAPLARREGAPGGRRRSIPGSGPPRPRQWPVESEARKGHSTSGGGRARARRTDRSADGADVGGSGRSVSCRDA